MVFLGIHKLRIWLLDSQPHSMTFWQKYLKLQQLCFELHQNLISHFLLCKKIELILSFGLQYKRLIFPNIDFQKVPWAINIFPNNVFSNVLVWIKVLHVSNFPEYFQMERKATSFDDQIKCTSDKCLFFCPLKIFLPKYLYVLCFLISFWIDFYLTD